MTGDPYRWEGDRIRRWLSQADGLERQLAPVSDVLFTAAELEPSQRILDVGCGHGPTTRRAAELVGPTGSVTGVDISGEMLRVAAGVDVPDGSAKITWLERDCVSWSPEAPMADVVISRFGVMFFDDPIAAFENLAEATDPGGRLTMATWDQLDRNELFDLPYRVATEVARQHQAEAPRIPVAGGPYSLPDGERIRAVLEPAGWEGIEVDHRDLEFAIGGGMEPAEAAEAALELGPVRIILAELPELREPILEALVAAFDRNVDADGAVTLGGRVAVTKARRGS